MRASAVETFAALAARIEERPARLGNVRLVAVDGPGGAGKSYFAARLARRLGEAQVVATDDFASWDNPLGWWQRLEEDLLQPLERTVISRYRRWDWHRRQPAEWQSVRPEGVVILEGVSSSRQAVTGRLTLSVWIDTPADERLSRGLERDGEAMLPQWQTWIAEESAHFAADGAPDRADLLVDGSRPAPDPEREYVRLEQR